MDSGHTLGPARGMTGGAGTQVYGVIHGCSISWEEATLRRKALPLLMEWDAARPHTQVSAILRLSCCLTRHHHLVLD